MFHVQYRVSKDNVTRSIIITHINKCHHRLNILKTKYIQILTVEKRLYLKWNKLFYYLHRWLPKEYILPNNMSQGNIGLDSQKQGLYTNYRFSYLCRHFLGNIDKLMFLESHEYMTAKKTTIIYCMKRMFMNALNLINRGRV